MLSIYIFLLIRESSPVYAGDTDHYPDFASNKNQISFSYLQI